MQLLVYDLNTAAAAASLCLLAVGVVLAARRYAPRAASKAPAATAAFKVAEGGASFMEKGESPAPPRAPTADTPLSPPPSPPLSPARADKVPPRMAAKHFGASPPLFVDGRLQAIPDMSPKDPTAFVPGTVPGEGFPRLAHAPGALPFNPPPLSAQIQLAHTCPPATAPQLGSLPMMREAPRMETHDSPTTTKTTGARSMQVTEARNDSPDSAPRLVAQHSASPSHADPQPMQYIPQQQMPMFAVMPAHMGMPQMMPMPMMLGPGPMPPMMPMPGMPSMPQGTPLPPAMMGAGGANLGAAFCCQPCGGMYMPMQMPQAGPGMAMPLPQALAPMQAPALSPEKEQQLIKAFTETQHALEKHVPQVPKPSAQERQELLRLWVALHPQVQMLAESRDLSKSRHHCCQGCGMEKLGHKRSSVHTTCPRPMCWCGVHRLLHPVPLMAGAECQGEWRDLVRQSYVPAQQPSMMPAPF